MNNSRYVSGILTVIAICLVIIAGRELGFIREAVAQSTQLGQRVTIVGWELPPGDYGFPVIVKNKLVPVANGYGNSTKLVPLWTTDKDPNGK